MVSLPLPGHGKSIDLKVVLDGSHVENRNKCEMAVNLGYDVLVLDTNLPTTYKMNKKSNKTVPKPTPTFVFSDDFQKQLKGQGRNIMQLKRITIELDVLDDLFKVRSVLMSGEYDVVAVVPRNSDMFHRACELNIDIICLDPNRRNDLRQATIRSIIARGVYFEFLYSPMIRDKETMRNTIKCALRLNEWGKGKNVVLSCGATESEMDMRAPHDVGQLSTLLGIPQNQANHCIQKNARAVIVHGFQRKTAKSAAYFIVVAEPIDPKEQELSYGEPQPKRIKTEN